MEELGVCPECKEEGTLIYGAAVINEAGANYPYICENCEHEGREWYEIIFNCHIPMDE